MKRKLELICFTLFYHSAVLGVLASLAPQYCMVSCLLTDVTFVAYCWVRHSADEFFHRYRHFVYAALLMTILHGAVAKHSIVPFIFLGPVFLGYLRLEGGFRRAKVS